MSRQDYDRAEAVLDGLTKFHDEEDVRHLARAMAEHRRAGEVEALRQVANQFATDPGLVDAENWVRERAARIARQS